MAYTSAPEKQTYSSERISPFLSIDRRGTSSLTFQNYDEGTVNLFPKKYQKDIYMESRSALKAARITSSNLTVRGIYVWEKTAGTVYYFAVAGTGVFTSTDAKTWTQVDTLLTNATTPVGFTEHIDGTNTKKLVLVDGVEGYVYTSNAAGTKITDVDFPSPHLPFPVFLDGYIFLAKAGTGDIYNSDLNNPAAWTAGSFISSEVYPDDLQALVKINNYILAIGKQGSEYFYDAANATASPLARYEGGLLPFGTNIPYSVTSNNNYATFIANKRDGEQVIIYVEDFKIKEIKAPFLIQYINTALANSNSYSTSYIRGFFLREAGQLLYVLNLNVLGTTKTYFYSFEFDFWGEFQANQQGGAGSLISSPITCASSATTDNLVNFVGGVWLGLDGNGNTLNDPFFGIIGLGKFASSSNGFSGAYTDEFRDLNGGGNSLLASEYIPTEIRTPIMNFDTLNLKTMARMGVIINTEMPSGTINLTVSWTDDDYNSFSSSRTLNASPTTDFPFITQLGKFRQRAFKITYPANTTGIIQYHSIEMDINKGQQ